MSSRQEEKERRRQEREERERAAAVKAKRSRLLQMIGGLVVACAIVVGVVLALSKGGDDGAAADTGSLSAAAKKADCVYRSFPEEGRDHVDGKLTAADFKSNPATSGAHNPTPAQDGEYSAGNEPEIANWVHTLEHGRILFQYRPGVDASVVDQLEALFKEDVNGSGGAYHSVLMRNNSKMPFQVAAVSWRHYLGCEKISPEAIEAMRLFRRERVDKAPEIIP